MHTHSLNKTLHMQCKALLNHPFAETASRLDKLVARLQWNVHIKCSKLSNQCLKPGRGVVGNLLHHSEDVRETVNSADIQKEVGDGRCERLIHLQHNLALVQSLEQLKHMAATIVSLERREGHLADLDDCEPHYIETSWSSGCLVRPHHGGAAIQRLLFFL